MPVILNRRGDGQGNVLGLRGKLHARLTAFRERLVARDGPESLVLLWNRAYGLDRIEQIERGEPVDVVFYEVDDLVPADQRAGIDRLSVWRMNADGTLRAGEP